MGPSNSDSAKIEWTTLSTEYEGFPLYLRFPHQIDHDALQEHFPVRLALTHEFTFRRFDGTPEPAYNDTLEEFDHSLVTYFESSGIGQIVLVETFGGKR